MKKFLHLFALTLFLVAPPSFGVAQSDGSKLTIEVSNIKTQKGSIRLAVFDNEEDFLGENVVTGMITKVTNTGTMTISLENLPEGNYAISLYHDKNDNGNLDTNFLGIPNEPYGFSNNARGRFGPPKFEKAKFAFTPLMRTIRIRVK